ncbi:glycosyltransferase family 9 protein [candidate division KSB1 bacterium]|nr:glycosyltransferase family 9 protein [candidate division KSB1 bacterium]
MEIKPARVLIIDTAWLGDVVFTSALFGAVKHCWPDCALHVVVAPRGLLVIEGDPRIAQIHVLDKRVRHRSVFGLREFANTLRPLGFDLVLNAHPSFRSRLLTRWMEAPVSVGYRGFLAESCFTHVIDGDLARQADHVQRRLELLRPFAKDIPAVAPEVHVTEADRQAATGWLEAGGAEHPILGLVVGSAWRTKRWPIDRFETLAEEWLQVSKGSVIVFAGDSEAELAQSVQRVSAARVRLAIQQPLGLVRGLLKSCEVVLGNDTGITFLAAAVGGPRVIALYGSTQVNYLFPPPHLALHAGVPCCLSRYGHGGMHCRWHEQGDAWCMKQISVERVWEEVRRGMKDEG